MVALDLFEYVNDQWLENSLWSAEELSVYRQIIRTNNDTYGMPYFCYLFDIKKRVIK
jgi:hypothetical protein